MSLEENNKALVRRFLEAQAKANLNVIDEVLTPHFVDHDRLPGQAPDREGYKRAIAVADQRGIRIPMRDGE